MLCQIYHFWKLTFFEKNKTQNLFFLIPCDLKTAATISVVKQIRSKKIKCSTSFVLNQYIYSSHTHTHTHTRRNFVQKGLNHLKVPFKLFSFVYHTLILASLWLLKTNCKIFFGINCLKSSVWNVNPHPTNQRQFYFQKSQTQRWAKSRL